MRVHSEKRFILSSKNIGKVSIPYPFRFGKYSLTKLSRCGFWMLIDPSHTAISTSETPIISMVPQNAVRASQCSSSGDGLDSPSISRSRFWNRNATASVNAVLGTPLRHVVVYILQCKYLLHVVSKLMNSNIVALIVHPLWSNPGAK